MYAASRECVVILALGDLVTLEAFCKVCVYYCRTYYKAVRGGGGGEWTTCAMIDDEPRPVWMSPLIANAGGREIVGKKEGEQKGSARGSVHWSCYYATALDIEVQVDPQLCDFVT